MVEQLMDNSGAVNSIRRMIQAYKQNPEGYSDDELMRLKEYASAIGEDLDIDFSLWRALKNFGYEAADTASFGLLPDSWSPASLNTGEDISRIAGGLLGFLAPMGVGGAVAGKAMGGIAKAAAKGEVNLLKNLVGKGATLGDDAARGIAEKGAGWWDDLTGAWKKVSAKYGDDAAKAVDAGADAAGAASKLTGKIRNLASGEGIGKAAEYGDAALLGLAKVATRAGVTPIAQAALKYGVASAVDQGFEDPFGALDRGVKGAVLGGIGGVTGKLGSSFLGSQTGVAKAIRGMTLGLIKEGYSQPRAAALAYAFVMNQIKDSGRFNAQADWS